MFRTRLMVFGVACLVSAFAAAPARAQVNFTINGSLGDLDGSGDGGAGEDAIVQAVAACWAVRVGTVRNFTLNVMTAALTGGTIGQGAVQTVDGMGVPTSGRVTFDNDGSTVYYVDTLPIASGEFTPDALNNWRYTGGPASTDLYSVVNHEVGHAMAWLCGGPCGFTNPNYDALMNPAPGSFVANPACGTPFPRLDQAPLAGCVQLQGAAPPMSVALRGDGLGGSGSSVVNELSHPGITGDLMIGFYNAGARELQSVNDVLVFANAYNDAINLPPTITAGNNILSECNATGGSNVALDGSASTDPEDILAFNWSCPGVALAGAGSATPSGFFPLDETVTCRMEANDLAVCPPDADEMMVTVQDTTDPDITCPAPITVECTAAGGSPATDAGIAAFLAGATATDVCDATLAIGHDAPGFFPVGAATPVTFSTQDDSFNGTSCAAAVTVEDTTPPVIAGVAASPDALWPPNHRMVPVALTVDVSDVCDAAADCTIDSVTSTAPLDGLGDGAAAPDWVITGALTLDLRAERSGNGGGRVYTITVKCTDDFDNSTFKSVNVTVGHNTTM